MKQSLAARFLFRAVVLALLVYAMLLTWWTPFTGDSFMHSVFGAGHRLAFQPVLERCWWSYMNWNPRLGEFLAVFTATAGKWLFLAVNPFVILSLALMMFYLARGRRVNPGSGGMFCCFPRAPSSAHVFIQTGHHDVLAVRRDKLCVVSRRLAGLPVPVPRLMGRDLPD